MITSRKKSSRSATKAYLFVIELYDTLRKKWVPTTATALWYEDAVIECKRYKEKWSDGYYRIKRYERPDEEPL